MAQKILNNCSSFYKSCSKISDTNPKTKEELAQSHIHQALELEIEICGSWVWIFNASSAYETKLNAANFNWSYRKGGWYWSSGSKKPHKNGKSYSMEKIREKYGSQFVQVW